MNTITQGTLYRFRTGGFPEIPQQPIAPTDQQSQLHQLEDLFVATKAVDQGPEDRDPRPGHVQLEVSPDQVERHCEHRSFKGDTQSGQLSANEDCWSEIECSRDQSRCREVHFEPKAVESIEIEENCDGVHVHLWHLDRDTPELSYQQSW